MAASPFQFGAAAPGAPPASPFGFSAATAAAAPAGNTSGFGAAASVPAFSFGSAPAAAPATPAFGTAFGAAAAKPATFGAASSASAFGTTAAPAFGAPAGGAFSFQSTAPGANTAFGAPTSAPSLFGNSTAPAFGAPAASAPSLFGTSTAPATTGGLFGGTAAATATNIFGQPQQPQQANVFGSAPGQPQLPGLVDPSGLTQDDAVRALTRLAAAYNPASPDFRFQTLFVSVVDRSEQRVKPPGPVDENRWRAALAAIKGPENVQKLWPVVANGFRDFNARSRMQADAVTQNATRLRELQDRAAVMSRRAAGEFRSRIAALQRQHTDLSHKLLHVLRCVDALESRLALSAGYNAQQSRQQVAELSRQLGRLEEAVAPATAAAGLQRRLEAVAAAARMRAGGADGNSLASVSLDGRSQTQLFTVLRDHAEAVRQLQAVLKQDELDTEVLKRLTTGGGPGSRGQLGSELMTVTMG